MTIQEYVLAWDNRWRYDFWWRQKHNIAFNSRAHREVSQLDIVFEYFESDMSNKAIAGLNEDGERKKMMPWVKNKYSWAGIARKWNIEFKRLN